MFGDLNSFIIGTGDGDAVQRFDITVVGLLNFKEKHSGHIIKLVGICFLPVRV